MASPCAACAKGDWRPISQPELALVRNALRAATATADNASGRCDGRPAGPHAGRHESAEDTADNASGCGDGRPARPHAGPPESAEDTDADGE